MSAVSIRPLQGPDENDWRRLWTLYLEYYETELTEEVYEATWRRLLSGEDNEFRGLLAICDGRAVGLTHYLFHRHCWRIENVCYLQDLFVDPSMRGTGLGRQLIEAVYEIADANNIASVYWLTQEHNTTARQLYDRIAKKTDFVHYSSTRSG